MCAQVCGHSEMQAAADTGSHVHTPEASETVSIFGRSAAYSAGAPVSCICDVTRQGGVPCFAFATERRMCSAWNPLWVFVCD
jgi:hypothetical protein